MAQAATLARHEVSTDGGKTFEVLGTGLDMRTVGRQIGRVREEFGDPVVLPTEYAYTLIDPETDTVWRWTAEDLTPAG